MKPGSVVVAALCLLAPCLIAAEGHGVRAGEWPQWRGNSQHTGVQPVAGAIEHPGASALGRLGASVTASQVLLAATPQCENTIFLATPGVLTARCTDDRILWTNKLPDAMSPRGVFDFNGDGKLELLVASSGFSLSHIDLFDVATGRRLWSSDRVEGGVGAIAVGDLDGDGRKDVVWAPAGESYIRAFTASGEALTPLWNQLIPSYQSDPYTHSPIVVADLEGDGQMEVILAGGRHQFALIVLRGSDGVTIGYQSILNDGSSARLVEGGGDKQMLAVRDINNNGDKEIVVVGGWPSAAQYMFQGLIVASSDLQEVQIASTAPVGLTYAAGSLVDFDGDGSLELVTSRYNLETRQHSIRITDLRGFATRAVLDDLRLVSVVEQNGEPVLLARMGDTFEESGGIGKLRAIHYDKTFGFYTAWQRQSELISDTGKSVLDPDDASNVGAQPVIRDIDEDGDLEVLVAAWTGQQYEIQAVELDRGDVVASFPIPRGDVLAFAGTRVGDPDSTLFVALKSGMIAVLDRNLAKLSWHDAGGYYLHDAANGHTYEAAIIADVDGDGANEIYAYSPKPQVLRIDANATAPAMRVFSTPLTSQQLVTIDVGQRRALLVRGCVGSDISSLCAMTSDGSILWTNRIAGDADDRMPIGLNRVRFGGIDAVVTTTGATYPLKSRLISAETGADLWSSSFGPFWDATYAVADVNGDGFEDLAFNYSQEKCWLISGADGSLLSYAGYPLEYGDMKVVDYNGALIAYDIDGNGVPEFLSGQDDAYLSAWRPSLVQERTELLWGAPFRALDDERDSMPAIASTPRGPIVASGSRRGWLTARSAVDGETLWAVMPRGGALVSTTEPNRMSSVLAMDVDGDGDQEFVVGGYDGWLYAVDAMTGQLNWALNMGAAVGDPIAGDIDDDGESEIVVAVADGHLYSIDERPVSRRRAVQ